MIVEYLRYTIPAETAAAFVRDYDAAREVLLQSPFASSFEMCRCVEDGTQFILRIGWTSVDDHLQGFRTSALFRDFLGHVRAYVPMIDEMRHDTLLSPAAA